MCADCWADDKYPRIELTLPDTVHCSDCGARLGRLSENVDHPNAALIGSDVKDYETNERLAEVRFFDDKTVTLY